MKNTQNGFTLAEVLITLAIIGIVATLTIPNLIQSYKKTVVETRLKRVYSLMNQAIRLSEIDNGPTESWDTLGTSGSAATYNDILAWYNKYLNKYIKSIKVEKAPESEWLIVYLPDGSALEIANYIYDIEFFINAKDIKATDNKSGITYFLFRFSPILHEDQIDNEFYKYVKNPGFEPFTYRWDGTIEGCYNNTNPYSCTVEGNGHLCTKWIQLNGWKIPDDYPFKF